MEIVTDIRAAQELVKRERRRGLAMLNEMFRSGSPPNPPLDGSYQGALVALDIAPGLTQLGQWIAGAWLPWKGKWFDAARACGANIFTRDSLLLARLAAPLYRGYVFDSPTTYHAFKFRTRVAAGLTDPDRQVLKIDYDLPENPRLTVRRVLDELVQLDTRFYLGKAHLKWWWGQSQRVAYFSLAGE